MIRFADRGNAPVFKEVGKMKASDTFLYNGNKYIRVESYALGRKFADTSWADRDPELPSRPFRLPHPNQHYEGLNTTSRVLVLRLHDGNLTYFLRSTRVTPIDIEATVVRRND